MSEAAVVRPAQAQDLEGILILCAEHAAFERSPFCMEDARGRLGGFLFGESPRARCFVAQAGGSLIGYATYASEFSTWRAAEYVHMDCLFVREGFRNAGLGGLLLRKVAEAAVALGCDIVEWQTPSWNRDAVRFYDRAGAVKSEKMRYRLRVGAAVNRCC
jgi:GNAT superfamily N-acetyltransferase